MTVLNFYIFANIHYSSRNAKIMQVFYIQTLEVLANKNMSRKIEFVIQGTMDSFVFTHLLWWDYYLKCLIFSINYFSNYMQSIFELNHLYRAEPPFAIIIHIFATFYLHLL